MNAKVFKVISVLILLVGASVISVGERYHEVRRTVRSLAAGATGELNPADGTAGVEAGLERTDGVAGRSGGKTSKLACDRARNGGATDVGVTAGSIKLGATVVKSGIGASFLKEVPIAMEAVKNKVNRAGGICGRLLQLTTANDEWNAARGQGYIRSFIQSGTFALAVSPSSEGLDAAIRSGEIGRAGIPVVGADGMLISQYTEPWVWPVAASTITTMHVMAKNAAERGATKFGIVYDMSYHFGVEGEAAFRGALKRLFPQSNVLLSNIGVQADSPSYKTAVEKFNRECEQCDFVAMLLEPPTALQWIRDGGKFGSLGTGGPQPLFVDSFARSCGEPCNGMWVWTGYRPPIPPFDDIPSVARYINDVRAQSSSIDISNPFVQGGYLGMELLVDALKKTGPNLTRARLKDTLDSMTYDTGMTVPLKWTPGNHFANNSVNAFSIVINANSFAGWRYEQTDWIEDPWVGLDAPKR